MPNKPGNWKPEEKELPQIKETSKTGNIFGLNEGIFRRTIGQFPERKRDSESKPTSTAKINSKFDQFKYKRLLLDQY